MVGSKDEQERLFIEAERDYEQRMSKLADAQLAADGKNEQDMDREMRVQEMEDAINRAIIFTIFIATLTARTASFSCCA